MKIEFVLAVTSESLAYEKEFASAMDGKHFRIDRHSIAVWKSGSVISIASSRLGGRETHGALVLDCSFFLRLDAELNEPNRTRTSLEPFFFRCA